VEAAIGRWKRVIGEALRSQTARRRVTEVVIATNVLNRLLELGRPDLCPYHMKLERFGITASIGMIGATKCPSAAAGQTP
jgi:hypothetical protein